MVVLGAVAGAAGLLGEHPPVVERVDEPRRPQEVGEAVGLVRPLRVRHRVVAPPAGAGRHLDLAVLRPRRGALARVVETMRIAAGRVGGVEELHPLPHGDLELTDAVAVVDAADQLTAGLSLGRFRAGLVDDVRKRDDRHRRVTGRADRDGPNLDRPRPR